MTNADLMIAIQNLLQKAQVGTQEEIKAALQKKGIEINQVKISRLLQQMGAFKMTQAGKTIYCLPQAGTALTTRDSLRHLILGIASNESLVVIHTTPGSAQLVAKLLDQQKLTGVLGTVAGDDTIFIAPEKVKHIQIIFDKIYALLLG